MKIERITCKKYFKDDGIQVHFQIFTTKCMLCFTKKFLCVFLQFTKGYILVEDCASPLSIISYQKIRHFLIKR